MRNSYKLMVFVSLVFFLCSAAVYAQNTPGKININTANVEQLTELPGVGNTTAERIVEFRSNNGSFESKEQLMEVKGIGEKTFEKIQDLISL